MTDSKIYGGYAVAIKNGSSYTSPVGIYAESIEEALGKAILLCREANPKEDGWHNHSADVVELLPPNKEVKYKERE